MGNPSKLVNTCQSKIEGQNTIDDFEFYFITKLLKCLY